MDRRSIVAHYDAAAAAHTSDTAVLNNWAKASLARDAVCACAKPPGLLLDLAGGRGGDIGKWTHEAPSLRAYTLLDISPGAVDAARVRAAGVRAAGVFPPALRFRALVGDAADPACTPDVVAAAPYDLLSCQFALNYLAPRGAPLAALFSRWYALTAPGGTLTLSYANWDALEAPPAGAPYSVHDVAGCEAGTPPGTAPRPDSYSFSLPPHVNALREWALTPTAVLAAAIAAGWEVVAAYDSLTNIPRNDIWDAMHRDGPPSRGAFTLAAAYAGAVFRRSTASPR